MIAIGKKTFLTIMLMASFLVGMAQSADANYVKTEVFTTPDGANNLVNIDYFDRKGRISQHLSNGMGNGNFIRTYYEYDTCGALHKYSSPMDSQNDLSYKKSYDLSDESEASYDGDKFAYTTLSYDGLRRLSSTIGPGFDWYDDDNGVNYTYSLNKENTIKHYEVSEQNDALVDRGVYAKNNLMCKRTEDEDRHKKEVYVDEVGRKILERSIGQENHDTYYVYDKLNRLRYILSPQYQKIPNAALYAYQYTYDERNRLVSKTIPGRGKTCFCYDSSDRLVLKQDAMLQRKKLYRVFLYDALGRLCIQGTCKWISDKTEKKVLKYEASQEGIAQTGYVCQEPGKCEFDDFELEEVRYYDNYEFLGKRFPLSIGLISSPAFKGQLSDGKAVVAANIEEEQAKGLLTGRLQICSSGEKLYYTYSYDSRGRLVSSLGSYGENKKLFMSYVLDYMGHPVESSGVLSYKGKYHSFSMRDRYHPVTGKNLEKMLSVDGQPYHRISTFGYDKLGRLISQFQGASNTVYAYNVRGWLRHINSPGLDEELMYTNYEVNDGPDFYNGNLGTIEFTLPDSKERLHVEYNYDSLDRLTNSKVYEYDSDNILSEWKYGVKISSYDLNGNINSMERKGRKDDGSFGLIDDLELHYDGNQLVSVDDNAEDVYRQGSTDFKTNANNSVKYTFDENGNMLSDGSKGIYSCEYDCLNFPKRIYMSGGHQIEYDYTPTGGKLRTVYHLCSLEPFVPSALDVNPQASFIVVNNDTTEYLGNFILRNGELDKVLFAGGFVSIAEDSAKYHYFTHDQQGNVRAVFDENGKVEQYLTYDALGNIIPELSSNVDFQPYAFNGKELDRTFGLNLHDFGFRSYDSVLGRWTSIDRKCEDYASTTPYAFCMNNFVNGIDPFGLDYWSTSNPETIRQFMENIRERKGTGDFYKNFELHATDADFLSNLTYNDEKGEYYANFGRVENGVATCVGVTLRAGMAVASDALQLINILQKTNVGLFGAGNSISVQNELFDFASSLQTDKSYMQMHSMSTREITSLNTRAFGSGTSKFINMSKNAGKILGWGSVAISILDAGSYLTQGGTNTNVYIKNFADIGVGILAIYGGPIGLGIGIGYTLTMMYLESSGTINLERTY